MAAAAAAVLLVAVLLRRRDRAALEYAATTLAFGLWSLGRGGAALELAWGAPLERAGLALVGPAALALAAALAGEPARVRRIRYAALVAAPMLAVAGIAVGPEHGTTANALALGWALAGTAGAGALLWRRSTRDPLDDSPDTLRTRYLATAKLGLAAGIGADVGLWWVGAPRVGTLLTALVYLYVAYLALARVRIADLRQLMGNTIALSMMAGGLAAFFSSLWVWVGPRLDLFVFNAFVASFVLLLFYEPVQRTIQHAMERRFVAGKLELERTLLPLRERLLEIVTLDELLNELLQTLEQTDRVTGSSVFLREDPHLGFQQAASIGLSPRPRVNLIRDPVFVHALESSDVLMYEELERREGARSGADAEDTRRLRRIMLELDAQLVLPFKPRDHVVGFWTLTDAESREPFSTSEVGLLRSVADQAAVSIENSKTFERIRARDRLVSIGEMAAGLAHEIRNPLATIRGAIAVIDESARGSNRDLSDVIVEEVQRLDRVVGTFLDYARPSLYREAVSDVGEFVTACVNGVASQHSTEDVELRFDVEAGLPPVSVDPTQLETVISNVVRNAYDSLDGKGTIRISVFATDRDRESEPGVEIAVEDDGPGMNEDTLERAFVPFFTTKEQGVGMGLALCERLVRAQGGSIQLRSRPDEGTAVTIRLPVDGDLDDGREDPA
jgi:two-component system sensor histidine kinase HydH